MLAFIVVSSLNFSKKLRRKYHYLLFSYTLVTNIQLLTEVETFCLGLATTHFNRSSYIVSVQNVAKLKPNTAIKIVLREKASAPRKGRNTEIVGEFCHAMSQVGTIARTRRMMPLEWGLKSKITARHSFFAFPQHNIDFSEIRYF